jgi:glycosyltransferase involved in cell wall biosynthesis
MQESLKVLMIGSDRNLFDPNSTVSERHKDYGKLVGELHIIVLSNVSHNLKDYQLSNNVWIYPTNSLFSFLRPLSASKLGKKIIFDKKFVRGESLITGDSIECGWAGLRVKRKWRIPLEVQLHTDPFSDGYSGFQNLVRKLYLQRVLKNADSIRVVGSQIREAIRLRLRISVNRVVVLPIYVDKDKVANGPIKFDLHSKYGWKFIILMVTRLAPEKNIPYAFQALKLLITKYPGTGLVIVGSGEDNKTLIKLAKAMGIDMNVGFVGWQNELASYYRTANLFLQTSNYEGYGLALIEAGLSSLPIVSTPVGVATEFENGRDLYICPPKNPEYLASLISDLIENNIRRENLKINMLHALENKLLSKDEYQKLLKQNWENTAKQS